MSWRRSLNRLIMFSGAVAGWRQLDGTVQAIMSWKVTRGLGRHGTPFCSVRMHLLNR